MWHVNIINAMNANRLHQQPPPPVTGTVYLSLNLERGRGWWRRHTDLWHRGSVRGLENIHKIDIRERYMYKEKKSLWQLKLTIQVSRFNNVSLSCLPLPLFIVKPTWTWFYWLNELSSSWTHISGHWKYSPSIIMMFTNGYCMDFWNILFFFSFHVLF